MKLAKQFFPGINIGHQAVRTPVQALEQLQSLGYTDIIFIAGSDRVDGFQKLFDTYNGQPDKSGNIPFKFNSIKVVSAGERDPDADGAEGMSASKMRAAAAAGDLESFAQGAPDKKLAKTMYDAVRKGMGVKDEVPANEILGFARLTPKKATVKKNKEKFDEPTIADKIAARRKAAAKGDKNAWSSKKELNVAEDGTAEIAAMAAVAGLAAPVMTAMIKGAFKTGKGLLKVKKIAHQAGVKLSDKIVK